MPRHVRTYIPHEDPRNVPNTAPGKMTLIQKLDQVTEAQRIATDAANQRWKERQEQWAKADDARESVRQRAEAELSRKAAEHKQKMDAVKLSQLTVGTIHTVKMPERGGAEVRLVYPKISPASKEEDRTKPPDGGYVLLRISEDRVVAPMPIQDSDICDPFSCIGREGRHGLKAFLSEGSFATFIVMQKAASELAVKVGCNPYIWTQPLVKSVKVVRVAQSKKAVTVEVLEWEEAPRYPQFTTEVVSQNVLVTPIGQVSQSAEVTHGEKAN